MRAWKPLQMPSIRPSRFFSSSMVASVTSGLRKKAVMNLPEPSGSSPPEKPPGTKMIWLSRAAAANRAAEMIGRSQMIVLPGGFSGGDEPDGSAKFITAFFRNPAMKDAVAELLEKRDGLMLGICNGFQALVKLGLVPFGRIVDTDDQCPTLTFNEIGRHQSMLVRTRIASNLSPWLSRCGVDDIHTIAISHGEGRFVGPESLLRDLAAKGQIATQYVDLSGHPSMDMRFNPNASYFAIEGITSPDGRVLGKMGHTERSGDNLYKNVPGNKYQPLFEGGVDYFR